MLRIAIVGVLMGAAEVVPGVSGGTIAFVSGFYERLVNAIQRFTPVRLLEIRDKGVIQLWHELDINFLLVLFGAMLVSVFLFANVISYLLAELPVVIWSVFFGLVLASVYVVGRKLDRVTLDMVIAAMAGASIGIAVTLISPLEIEVTPVTLFAGGCIAVCAWILPGMSGSFLLLILGLYPAVILAVSDLDLVTLLYVALGCLVGIVAFSRLLSLLLQHFYELTISLLIGFMLGSLAKIWPWKHTTSYQIRADGSQLPVVQEPVSPANYELLTGADPMILFAGVGLLTGAVLILLLDHFAFAAGQKPANQDADE